MRTNKTRINLDFGQGGDSFVLQGRTGTLYSYEQDSRTLHEQYGGRTYYCSRSGKSGAGYLEPSPNHDLIEVGCYRTDARGQQVRRAVGHTSEGRPLFGYVPYQSHVGLDWSMPAAVTDGSHIRLCWPGNLSSAIQSWDTEVAQPELWSSRVVEWYTLDGGRRSSAYAVRVDPGVGRRPDWRRFADLRDAIGNAQQVVFAAGGDQRPFPYVAMGVWPVQSWRGQIWLGYDPIARIFSHVWEVDPITHSPDGEMPGGWVKAGTLFWRRRGLEVYAFVWDADTGYFETVVPVLTWFARTEPEWERELRARLQERCL